jgi:hypothetical protein
VTHQFPSVYWPSATTVNGLEHPVKSAIICRLAWEYAAANVAPAPDAYPVTDAMAGTALANDREATKAAAASAAAGRESLMRTPLLSVGKNEHLTMTRKRRSRQDPPDFS